MEFLKIDYLDFAFYSCFGLDFCAIVHKNNELEYNENLTSKNEEDRSRVDHASFTAVPLVHGITTHPFTEPPDHQ